MREMVDFFMFCMFFLLFCAATYFFIQLLPPEDLMKINFSNVNRVEVIDSSGRVFVHNTGNKDTGHEITGRLQDDGKTLKIFIKKKSDE